MKHRTKTLAAVATLLAAAITITGCLGREKIAASKNYYILRLSPPQRQNAQIPALLKIRQVRAAAPYDGQSLIFHLGDGRFRADYYNQFLSPPDEQLTELLAGWLRDAAVFSNIMTATSRAEPDYILEPHLLELFCDITDKTNPTVNVKMRFVLLKIDKTCDCGRIAMDRTYQKNIKLSQAASDDIVNAAGQAAEIIFSELTKDLSALKP